MRKVHTAVIGAGTAGLAAYRAIKTAGHAAVLIEGGPGGTTCATEGCMPSKLLIAAAQASYDVDHAHHFGIHTHSKEVHGFEVMDRVRRERDRFVGFVKEGVDQISTDDKINGYASLRDDHIIDVQNGPSIYAEHIVIATGSTPRQPFTTQDLGSRWINNADVFNWKTLPKSLAVLGAGVIGLELGQALHRLGVHVKIFSHTPRIGILQHTDLQEQTASILKAELDILTNVNVSIQRNTDDFLEVQYFNINDGTTHTEQFEYVLNATGRIPNVSKLGLHTLNMLDAHGNPEVNTETLASVRFPHIYFVGDVNTKRPLLHEAADDGLVATSNILDVPSTPRRVPLNVVFTEPQLMTTGNTSLSSPQIRIGKVDFSNQGRSRVMLVNKGRLYLYVNKATRQLEGAEMIGPAAEHIGHLLSWCIQQRLTVDKMLAMPFYHPTIEEGLRTALRDSVSQMV